MSCGAPGARNSSRRPSSRETEIRCYIRDPDGHLIEVGQTTTANGWRPASGQLARAAVID